MDRTATQYSAMIEKKEDDLSRLAGQLALTKQKHEAATKDSATFQSQISTLQLTIQAQERDRDRAALEKTKLQAELDELRNMMAVKTNEDTRRTEVEKSREHELTGLREQVKKLQNQVIHEQQHAVEEHNKLKVEFDAVVRDHKALGASHTSLARRDEEHRQKLASTEESLSKLEKTHRSLESELQILRTRQIDTDSQLAEATKSKEVRRFSRQWDSIFTDYDLGVRASADSLSIQIPRL